MYVHMLLEIRLAGEDLVPSRPWVYISPLGDSDLSELG